MVGFTCNRQDKGYFEHKRKINWTLHSKQHIDKKKENTNYHVGR